jgi:hypothetical protein
MSMRVALILGIALVVAAVLHGGLYTAGHDFVMNRYTGWYEFVPADDYDEDESTLPTAAQCLTAHRTAATRLLSRRR